MSGEGLRSLKRATEPLIPMMASKLQSSESIHWLPATTWFCELLSGEDPPIETILNTRVVASLVLFLTEKDNPELQVQAAKALKLLACKTSEVRISAINQASDPVHAALVFLLHPQDERVLVHACCSLAVLSGCKNEQVSKLIHECGLYNRFLELTRHPTLVVAALRTLGNLMEGNAAVIDFCIRSGGILDKLRNWLTDDRVKVRTEACWIVSYITAGEGRWIQHVCDDGLIKLLVDIVQQDELVVIKAAVRAISNATFGATVEQIGLMVSNGCIEPLCKLFCCRDSEIFKDCLYGLENILKAGEEERNGAEVVNNNPYAERIKYIQGWTVLQKMGRLYERELYESALTLLVAYGPMSPARRDRILSYREECRHDYE